MRCASLGVLLAFLGSLAAPVVAAGGDPEDGGFASKLFPVPKSDTQRQWQDLFTLIFWIALVVFVVVEGLLLYALIRFRRRKDGPQEGLRIHGNTRMEIAWTIAPTLVMAWLLVISMQALSRVDDPPPAEFEVTVVGQQFYWEFFYPADANGDQASTRNILYVEEDKNVDLLVLSRDVIHAFSVPQLGVMIDAIPGHENHFRLRADEPGNYSSHCRELCGVGHGKMLATVVVFAAGSQALPYGEPPTAEPTPAAANETMPAADVDETFAVRLTSDFKIDPAEHASEPGTTLQIDVENAGAVLHNLYIGRFGPDDRKVDWNTGDLNPEEKESLIVELPSEPGIWEWWCDVPGHKESGMYGILSTGGTLGPTKKPILPAPGAMLLVAAIVGLAIALRVRRR